MFEEDRKALIANIIIIITILSTYYERVKATQLSVKVNFTFRKPYAMGI